MFKFFNIFTNEKRGCRLKIALQAYINLYEAEVNVIYKKVEIEKTITRIENAIKQLENRLEENLDNTDSTDKDIQLYLIKYVSRYYKLKESLTKTLTSISSIADESDFIVEKDSLEKTILDSLRLKAKNKKPFYELLIGRSDLILDEAMLQKIKHDQRRLDALKENFPAALLHDILERAEKLVDYFNDPRNYLYNIKHPLALPASPELKVKRLTDRISSSKESDSYTSSKPNKN